MYAPGKKQNMRTDRVAAVCDVRSELNFAKATVAAAPERNESPIATEATEKGSTAAMPETIAGYKGKYAAAPSRLVSAFGGGAGRSTAGPGR